MDHPLAPDPRPDLATIYRRHADAVATWARRMGGPELDVEDLVHEVFLVVQRRLPEWRGEAKITTWLYEITLRVVQDRRRRRHFWRGLGGGNGSRAGRVGDDELDRIAADQAGPVDTLEKREATAALYRILDGVAEKYRTVIVLFEIEGLSGEQIATLTGTSLANVWIRLHRGREKVLKRFLVWEAKGRP
ncbi:MAG TPA: sigma-70 family RNA polymerase sigma factor [Polyangia bacterium]|jgi:RNA polymerase sigma-70 factor (ECF subfamily)|nr:sigma-70 family RNA polymerase sigma factor [Polyangia bacterium]